MKLASMRHAMAFASLGVLFGCGTQDAALRKLNARSDVANADSMGAQPIDVRYVKTSEPADLLESSAVVLSSSQPDIVFTINDSGNEPVLFALDTTGATRGRWKVAGASNGDWEAAARGPCVQDASVTDSATSDISSRNTPRATACLFIGDVGDNGATRKRLTIYQLAEPTVTGNMTQGSLTATALRFSYPDGAHDVESMYVGPEGTVYLITKRADKDASGRLRQALLYSLPPAVWNSRDTAIATLLDSLPIVPGSADKRQITDASLSADSRYLAVRTYGQVFTFATDSLTGRVRSEVPPALCNIVQTERRHGEGVTWMSDGRELLLSHEGRNAPLARITCPLPQR